MGAHVHDCLTGERSRHTETRGLAATERRRCSQVERACWRVRCSEFAAMSGHPNTPVTPARVLVADDDEDMRTLVAHTLRQDGYQVVEARDGVELLARLEKAIDGGAPLPDVVLTDVMMPGLSGLGVLDAIRRVQIHIPVVLMTVLKDQSVQIVARRLGAVGVLGKPLDVDDVRTAILNARIAFARRQEKEP
jgi:CheY-like chemotaxis protein